VLIAGTLQVPISGDALGRRALRIPLLLNNVISSDAHVTAVNVLLKEYGSDGEFLARGVEGIRKAAAAWDGPGRVTVVEIPVVKVEIASLLHRDLARLTPMTLLVAIVILLFTFRSRRGVVIPLLAIGTGEIFTLGSASLTGRTVSVVSGVIPSVVLVVWASMILTAGFAVLLFSSFLPLVYLGLFMVITILVSLLCDLILLPALLLLTDR
jgi:hypothetical protein